MIRPPAQVTISLVTFNGLRWLPGCLASLREQTVDDYELLVLDNASTDGTLDLLRDEARAEPRMDLVESAANMGFAAGHNRNVAHARSEFVMLLNQDVELDPGFLAFAVGVFTNRPEVAAVQARLRVLDANGERTRMIDSTGLVMHRDRRVVARRQAETESERDMEAGYVWGADGPAPIYRRSALMDVREPCTGGGWEYLDEDFFMYKEDVDLAWRLRARGWRTWYEPRALAWHARGARGGSGRTLLAVARSNRSISTAVKRLSWRNHRLMQVKNEALPEVVVDLPWLLRREVLSLGFMALADRRRLSAVADVVRCLPSAMRKRRFLGGRRGTYTRPPWITGRERHERATSDR